MRVFLDTSILIPLFYGDHPHHETCVRAIGRIPVEMGFCSAHSLVETYSALTRMPGKYRTSSQRALLFIATLRARFHLVALTEVEYLDMIDECAAAGIAGGSVYDAVHAHCAIKARAEVLLTWNRRDFTRFDAVAQLVKSPLEF